MGHGKVLGVKELLVGTLLATALVLALFPAVVFGGKSIFSTDAILAVEPWASELEADRVAGHPHNPELGDHDFQFFPLLVEIQRQIHRGERATWNPLAYAGVPLAGNVQLALHDPFHALLPFFQDRDGDFSIAAVARGLSVTGLLRLLLCLVFAYAWLRRMGGSVLAAAFGAAFVGLGPYASLWRLHTPEQVFSLWPLALFFLEGVARRGSFLQFAGFTFALTASQLGGYPQTSLFFAAFCALYVVVRADAAQRWTRLRDVGIAGLLAAILCLPLWLPWWIYNQEGGFVLQRAGRDLIPPHALSGAGFVMVGIAASALVVLAIWPTRRLGWLGAPFVRGILLAIASGLAFFAGSDGQGPLVLLSDLCGFPIAGRLLAETPVEGLPENGVAFIEMAQDHIGALLAVVLLAAAPTALLRVLLLVLMIGAAWPFVHQALRWAMPLLEPSRIASLVPLLVAIGLVFALERLQIRSAADRQRSLARAARGILGFLTATACAVFLGHASGLSSHVAVLDLRVPTVDSALVLAFVVVLALPFGARPVAARVGTAFLVAGIGVLCAITVAYRFQPEIAADDVYPLTPTTRFLRDACAQDPDARVFAVAGDGYPGNALQTYGIPDVFALDGIEPRAFVGKILLMLNYPSVLPRRGGFQAADLAMLGTQLFDLTGARYVVTRKGRSLPAHFRVVHEGPVLAVAENEHAPPRAWLTTRRYDPDVEPRTLLSRAVTEHVALPARVPDLEPPLMQSGNVRVLERKSDELTVEAETDGAAWLVVRDANLTGWTATIDANGDAPSPVRMHGAFFGAYRAVAVNAGTSRVTFRYVPFGWPRTQLVALLVASVLAFAALLVIFLRMALWPFARISDAKRRYHAEN